MKQLIWDALRLIVNLLACCLFGFRSWGSRNVPAGGVIIACNHQSFLDPIFVTLPLRRQIHFLARRTLFRNLIFGKVISFLNSIPLEREGADIRAMRKGLKVLREGKILLLFPEGTRTRDGTIGRVRAGITVIAARSGCPVVPAAIHGAYEAWPRTQKVFSVFKPISLAFGKPILVPRDADGGYEAYGDQIREGLLACQAFLKERRRGGSGSGSPGQPLGELC